MTREEYKTRLLNMKLGNCSKNLQTAQPSKYPQGYFKQKKCKVCGATFTPKAPSEHTCSEYCRRYSHVEAYYKRCYGITIEQYLDIAESQNFVCAICKQENFPMGMSHSGLLVVDHDHSSGKVRGLLCHNCNRALGLLQDSIPTLSAAVSYLEGATTNRKV
jgi:predicted nucleic acid-binding Zn ribbon protein